MELHGVTPHWVFECKHCRVPIRLRAERLGQPFQDQDPKRSYIPPVVVVCRNCNHAEMYTSNQNSPFRSQTEPRLKVCRNEDTYFVEWLTCVRGSCRSRVPIFFQWNDAITDGDANTAISATIWGDIRCGEGH